jgi:CBS domain-containing protein
VTVRPREPGDLPALVTALRAVHERDGYPVTWKADPASWLTPDGLRTAWVVERDGRPVGLVTRSAFFRYLADGFLQRAGFVDGMP